MDRSIRQFNSSSRVSRFSLFDRSEDSASDSARSTFSSRSSGLPSSVSSVSARTLPSVRSFASSSFNSEHSWNDSSRDAEIPTDEQLHRGFLDEDSDSSLDGTSSLSAALFRRVDRSQMLVYRPASAGAEGEYRTRFAAAVCHFIRDAGLAEYYAKVSSIDVSTSLVHLDLMSSLETIAAAISFGICISKKCVCVASSSHIDRAGRVDALYHHTRCLGCAVLGKLRFDASLFVAFAATVRVSPVCGSCAHWHSMTDLLRFMANPNRDVAMPLADRIYQNSLASTLRFLGFGHDIMSCSMSGISRNIMIELLSFLTTVQNQLCCLIVTRFPSRLVARLFPLGALVNHSPHSSARSYSCHPYEVHVGTLPLLCANGTFMHYPASMRFTVGYFSIASDFS